MRTVDFFFIESVGKGAGEKYLNVYALSCEFQESLWETEYVDIDLQKSLYASKP